jgi:prepilin-type N-terminal cleavage/methylation domain-containing protein/prepilin-type processing-associated H-X9-DG protein
MRAIKRRAVRKGFSFGFTLIELLVVIAIIAILAAILFPVFARAREKARSSSCQSNLKQLALGMIMYSQDYDERFPNWNWGRDRGNPPVSGAGSSPLPWYLAIFPYVKNQQLYICPSDKRCPWGGPIGRMCCSDCKYERFPYSYGYNEPISANCCNFNAVASIRRPADTLLLGDCRASLGGWEPNGLLARYILADRPYACAGCGKGVDVTGMRDDYTRHLGGSNIAFVDGHVKWFRWDRLRTTNTGGPIVYRPSQQ